MFFCVPWVREARVPFACRSVPFACRFAVRVCVCLCACAGWAQLLCATVVLLNKIDLAEPAAEVLQYPVSKHAPRTLPHRTVLTEYSAGPRARHSSNTGAIHGVPTKALSQRITVRIIRK